MAVVPEATAPRFHFVAHAPSTFASPAAGRSLKRVKAVDLPTRHPMPASDPAITEHACFTPQAAVFALVGSPLVLAQTLDTALDFRSGAAPCERMALRIPGLIHQWARGLTSAPTRQHAPEAAARQPPPWSQKCADGVGSNVFIFKTDRAGPRNCVAGATLGEAARHRGRAPPTSPDHAPQRMTGIRPLRRAPSIPAGVPFGRRADPCGETRCPIFPDHASPTR